MFETIIALFIKRYVARYFDINADQLSAQLLYKQQIIIENLTLNKTTLNEDIRTKFKLPIKIESFHIGRIQCSFVLSSLFFRSSSPALIVKIEGIHVVVQPAIIDGDDESSSFHTSEENDTIKKQNQLNLAEQQLEKEFECFGEVKSSRWNVQRLLMSFCEKLQIEIVDVHISYQSSASYAIGFTCENIQISNESSDETMSRQVLRMINPGLYIDSHTSSKTHCYVLSPLSSMEIYLTHNHFLVSQKEYRYEFECSLNDLTMKCTTDQVRIIVDIICSIQYSSLRHMLLSDPSRPLSKISKQSAKDWWRYAALAILRIQDTRNSQFWFNRTLFTHRLHRLIAYRQLYRAYIDHKYFKCSNFSSEDELIVNEIEREFDVQHLLIVRRSIFQTRISEQLIQKKEPERWYSNYAKWITTKVIDLWGKVPAPEDTNTNLNENDIKLQEQVHTFIAETLEDEDLSENCQNALIFRFKFRLQSIEINLLSLNNDILFSFYLKNLSISTEFRLRYRSILVSACLEDFYIRDHEQMDAFAKIICSKERLEQVPVLEFSLEKKRKLKRSVYTIGMRSCGLCIVCSPATMERLHQLYRSTFGSSTQTLSVSIKNWRQIRRYGVRNLASILEQIIPAPTKSQLRYQRREKRKIQVDVNIGAPQIVIPLSSQGALIVDLGSVILTNNDGRDKNDVVTAVQENDEEEFLTPESSPLINDEPLEEETTYYSINTVPTDIEYASFSLSVCDIQVGYSVDLSQIVEKFSIHFLIQHRLDHLWPLINISGTIQKMALHLNPQVIQTLCDSMHPWIAFIDTSITKPQYQSDIWPALNFRLDEMTVQLNDGSQALCDIHLQNIDLNHHTKNLVLTLQTLTIFDGGKYNFLLKINPNDNFIQIHTNFSTISTSDKGSLNVDVHADKLDLIFNPKTTCALINFVLNTNLLSWSETMIEQLKKRKNSISYKVNSTFRELNVFVIDVTSMLLSSEVHLQNISLNTSLNPFSTFELTVTSIQILDLLNNSQQPTTALIISHDVPQNAALHLSLKNTENNTHNVSLKMVSVSYIHSLNIIATVQQTLDCMIQNCHLITKQTSDRINQIARPMLSIDLHTLKVIFPADITLQLEPIRIRNNNISIDRIEIKRSVTWPLLENISMSFDFQISDGSIKINSKLISPLRIYLSQYRIKLLQQLLQTPFVRHTSSSRKFAFHLDSTEMVVIFQTDRNDELVTVCEVNLNQCQIMYGSTSPQSKQITLQSASLHMKEHRMSSDESLITLTSVRLIDNPHERIDIKLSKIAIRFTRSTWKILLEIIEIMNSSGIRERKNRPREISINIDLIACLFQDDGALLMNIDLQRFNASIISSTINGQIGFISIRDLITVDQLYSERLHTVGTNAIGFTLTIEKDHSVQSQLHLQLKSIQYIHTQSFLFSLIDYFNRFRSPINQQHHGILLNIELENTILILPEHILKKPVLVFQLGYIHLSTSPLNTISIKMKDIDFYSSSHCLTSARSSLPIHFSKFGFSRTDTEPSSMVRQPFHLNLEIERNVYKSANQTSPISIIKINLSSIDMLFDINHYRLIENIFTYNLNNLWKSLTAQKSSIFTDFACIIEIDHVGLEVFMLEMDLLSFNHRRSVGYAALNNLHLSFDQYTNGNQDLHLLCSTMKLVDTRIQQEHMILPLFMPSDANQLEMSLQRTKLDNKCTITMNYMRFLVVIDWLLALNEFLNLFCDQPGINSMKIPIGTFEIKLNLNRFDLILVSTIRDPYSSALIYSSTMTMNYKQGAQPLKCSFNDFTFLTCQIGNIDETTISIIEPTDCSLDTHPSNELLDEQICEFTIPLLNVRLSYSDVHMIYSLIHTIARQISQAKTRKPLLTLISSVLTSPLRTLQSSATRFLNMKFLKFTSEQICLCLIDDCFGVNIPLLNIHLQKFALQTIENSRSIRTDQCEFDLNISYYNRFQSGFEPLIELCPLQMTLSRSPSSTLLFISSKETLNLNFTKAMYRLIGTVKTNWLADYQKMKKEVSYRRVKPSDPYCFRNLLGIPVKFRTWIIIRQCFSSSENTVDDNQTTSFGFPTDSSPTRQRMNSLVASLFQSDRRILITIDGWEPLQPISIDRVGTFFRLAKPSNHQQLYKPILVIIDIAMTDSSIRLITIRSSIEIRNQLLTSIDMRLTSQFNFTHEFCLQPNETRSLPIQLCSGIEAIYLRPANFALDYCNDPINWSEIEKNSPLAENIKTRQSFLRTCSMDGKEAVYYVCVQSKQTCLLTYANQSLSIHHLTILPPLTICNLLPCSLTFEIPSYPQKFELNAYKIHREHTVNVRENLDFLFATNLYRMTKPLQLPVIHDVYQIKRMHERAIFYDCTQRELLVDITIECAIEYRLKIVVSVPYVLLNKSGIPLIFKDSNSKIEAAGQTVEDESMCNREPLLFSFDNSNRTNTCLMRVGTGSHSHQDGRPQWSQRFSIEHGSTYRQLQVRSSRSSSDWNYSIGIDVRPGQGQLKKINFVFLSARYIICNQCSYDLLIAQRPIKTDHSNFLRVPKQATVAYHWPRTDMEQLLCVRTIDSHQYELVNWSGGFPIDCVDVVHINMRHVDGQCLILRVQVIERHGTFFVVLMDSNQMPAPFRITNRSNVPILFYQSEIPEEATYLRTVLQPHQLMDYTWDEPTLKPMMTCSIIDGMKATYDLLKLGIADDLNYQNDIYLAFQETFNGESLIQLTPRTHNRADFSSRQLVIAYTDHQLSLARWRVNERSQLWHMTANGILIHTGSSTASLNDSHKRRESFDDSRQVFVLDIEDMINNNNNSFNTLTVRRYDPKRVSTQTWQLLDTGYLCLANTQMCVQVFGELKEDSDLVLGPIAYQTPPLATMHIRSHQRYRGSGVLSVRVIADGPTNVLEINDKSANDLPITTTAPQPLSTTYHLDLHFPAGVGISVIGSIGHESEELIYLLVNNLHIEYTDKDNERSVEAKLDTLMISNQILTTPKPMFLSASYTDDSSVHAAIRLEINWQKFNNNFALLHIIHSLNLYINSIAIQLDEVLLWKLIEFFDIELGSLSSFLSKAIGIGNTSNTDRRVDLNIHDYETDRLLSLLTSTRTTRIYFNKLYLSSLDLDLSVYCIHTKRSLSPHVLAIKRRAPFPLVPFENAQIHLKSYEQTHVSNTYDFFLLSIMNHYINVGKRQAFKILGTVDFLGNPLGLIHDVTDGLTCLMDQRSVSGLVKNVAHGVADSTSKVTGSLSHGIGKLLPNHDRRQTTTDHPRNSTLSHVFRHGTAGLAAGFYGGLTSMIKQPYKGVVEDGVPGLVKGFAKGIVGTVSKPMVGILDFTNEMAIAIKEGARSSNTVLQNRIRLTRCPCNTLGLLQPYSIFDAQGHYLLYKINKENSTERYISRMTLSTLQNNSADKRAMATNNQRNTDAMITTQRVILYRIVDNPDTSEFEILNSYDFNTAITVLPIEDDENCAYIQILLHGKPSIRHRCDTTEQVTLFCREVQRAQNLFQEEKLIYIPSDDETEEFDE